MNTQNPPSYTINVQVSNAFGTGTSAAFTISVVAGAVNDLPTIVRDAPTEIEAGGKYVFLAQGSDADGDPLTWSLPNAPSGMTISTSGAVIWQTAAANVGTYLVSVEAADGRGGDVVYSFWLTVTGDALANAPPVITSTPILNATLGQVYAYNAQGNDPDGDVLSWSIEKGPYGMAIDQLTGRLRWTPTADELGQQDIIVKLADQYGNSATQQFTIAARAESLPPMIDSSPPTAASVNTLYTYPIRATDPQGGPLSFALIASQPNSVAPPAGMTINAATGLVEWTPGAAGVVPVTIQVSDDQGLSTLQAYSITVSSAPANTPPAITSTPPTTAVAGIAYDPVITATDGDGDTITYGLSQTPTPVAADNSDLMTISSTTGVINWTPSATQAAAGVQYVTITATDSAGLVGTYTYAIKMRASDAGATVTSTPVTTVTAGLGYAYDIQASDSDGDSLSYALTAGPAGMTVDQFGRVRWQTATADVGSYAVDVTVTDSFGVSIDQAYTLTVQADTTPPTVDLEVSPNPANINVPIDVLALAADDVGLANVALTLDGTPVALAADGSAVLTFTSYATHTLVETATDLAGLITSSAPYTLTIEDTADTQAPTLAITSPTGPLDGNGYATNAVITAPTNVVGTVSDPALKSYTLEAISNATGTVHVFTSVTSTDYKGQVVAYTYDGRNRWSGKLGGLGDYAASALGA